MANQEHLDILKQGVETWVQWRLEHSEIRPDLNRADLSGAHLNLADLRSADPTKGLIATQRFTLGAVFVYQLAL
jgi:uncharacterized protein YjbI with pentapeptide repeats